MASLLTPTRCVMLLAACCRLLVVRPAAAAERVLLSNGFSVDCVRHETSGDRIRLFLAGEDSRGSSYMDVAASAVASVTSEPDAPLVPSALPAAPPASGVARPASRVLAAAELHPMLAHAGEVHRIDEDLLASVVQAESGGRVDATSRTGARGLMQLMPPTAKSMGVPDPAEPVANVNGGAAYLDRLLLRYHDDIALALAAYNAGPGAVDRYHGVPPYRETRAYVARVIAEFNRRKRLSLLAADARRTPSQQRP